jgi:hypothetical protein
MAIRFLMILDRFLAHGLAPRSTDKTRRSISRPTQAVTK